MQQLLFYFFSAIILFAASRVITSRNPVQGVLFLVLAFAGSACLWMLLQAEFLSLVLIFVYVGAVMTLFLFVVMMLNIDLVPLKEGFVKYLPFGLLILFTLLGLMMMVVARRHFSAAYAAPIAHTADYSNVKELGMVLYTQYMYAFEIAAVLLLVAIISAISLAFRGRRNSLSQNIGEQVAANKHDRLRMVDLKRGQK